MEHSKAKLRAKFLIQLHDDNNIPDWAMGIEPLPQYVSEISDEMIASKQAHGKQTLLHLADALVQESVLIDNILHEDFGW